VIPFELLVGAWLVARYGWKVVWSVFVLTILIGVALHYLRVFAGIDLGRAIEAFIEQAVFMISDLAKGVFS
jgi:hypothetical protein